MNYLFTSAVDFWRPRKSASMEDLSKSFSIYMQHSDICSYTARAIQVIFIIQQMNGPLNKPMNKFTNLSQLYSS